MGATSEGREKRGPTYEGKAGGGERKREGKMERERGRTGGIAPMFARGIDATASWQLPTQSCHLVNRWKQDRR